MVTQKPKVNQESNFADSIKLKSRRLRFPRKSDEVVAMFQPRSDEASIRSVVTATGWAISKEQAMNPPGSLAQSRDSNQFRMQ